MNNSEPEQDNGAVREVSVNVNCSESSLAPSQKMIEIHVASKKKKEIISLDSSSQRIRQNRPLRLKEEQKNGHPVEKINKPKKTLPKCQLCKGTGKKVQMKTCIGCKLFFHLACLEQNEAKNKYLCDKCRAQQLGQSKLQKKQKKQQQKLQAQLQSQISPNNINFANNNVNKTTLKKLEKQKKREQSNKCYLKFQQKYPYYIGQNEKIKFPIEDKLLFIYKDYFESNQNRPTPTQHPLIPKKYLGDFLELENFIVSFNKEIEKQYSGQFKKSMLYLIMNSEGSDKIFEQLLGAIIKIYLKDIFEKNKTENVKILNDHAFFILLGTLNEDDVSSQTISIIAPEIIRHLSTVPSMKDSFKNFKFPEQLNLETKLKALIQLIQGLSEVDGFHDMVSRKSEKISQMTKDKADFVSHLKKNEAEALCNKQKIKQIQLRINQNDKKQAAEQNINEAQNGPSKLMNTKQIEKSRKKSQKLSNQHQLSSKLIKQFREKITEITKTIPFTISEIMFLGSDRNKSYYYFYLREPNRIYVRYHSYCLDERQDYFMYESKEKIIELMKSLNNKGINQKRLSDNINFLLKEQIIHNLSEEQKYRQFEAGKYEMIPNDRPSNYIYTQDQFKDKIISDIMEMQEKFSTYLAIKSCQWASQAKRQQFRLGFPYIDDIQAMKQAVKALQQNFLFVEVFKERDNRNQSDSNEENADKSPANFQEKQLIRRKKPIRIWGINSEKIKKFWHEYLETCIDYIGLWISVNIFKSFVDKYLEKKLESIRQQQRKQTLERERQTKRQLRQLKQQQLQEKRAKQAQQRARATRSNNAFEHESNQSMEQQQPRGRRPNLRSRNKKNKEKNNRRKHFTIDSDEQEGQVSQGQQQSDGEELSEEDASEKRLRKNMRGRRSNNGSKNGRKRVKTQKLSSNKDNSQYFQDDGEYDESVVEDAQQYERSDQSNNDQQCEICKEVGDVICCDTCPKVYHLECLKLKEVPEGEWSCMDCLQKLSNTRQTRSRARTNR